MLPKMTTLWLGLLLAVMSIAYAPTTSQGAPAPAPAGTVTYQTVDAGRMSAVRDQSELVIRDAAVWTALWQRHAGTARPVPAVDFEKEMVIAIFAGESMWSNGLVIIRVVREVDRLWVFYAMTDMKPLPISQNVVAAMPFHIVRVPKSTAPVWFTLLKNS